MGKYKVDITGLKTADLQSLSNEEMVELFKKFQQGNKSARELLVAGNLKLILSILKRFYYKNDNMDDLFQIGCVGLIKAIDNFDLSFGVKFSTYAVPMILGEIKRYIRDNSSLRISRSLKEIAYNVMRLKEDYYAKNGKEPTIDYLIEKLNVTEFEIANALTALKDPVSMYDPVYNDGGDTIYLYDQIEDKKTNNGIDNQLALENAISELKHREKLILEERFVIGKSQTEIAEELDISQAQVSRLEKKAVQQLKKVLK